MSLEWFRTLKNTKLNKIVQKMSKNSYFVHKSSDFSTKTQAGEFFSPQKCLQTFSGAVWPLTSPWSGFGHSKSQNWTKNAKLFTNGAITVQKLKRVKFFFSQKCLQTFSGAVWPLTSPLLTPMGRSGLALAEFGFFHRVSWKMDRSWNFLKFRS